MLQLRICPAKAYLTNKLDVFSENDPFIVFQLGTQKQRTKTKIDKKSPEWDEEFTFRPEADNILKIIAMDEDEILHEEIGSGTLDLAPYFKANQFAQAFVSLKSKAKTPAGKILVRIMPMNYTMNQRSKLKKLRSNDGMVWYVPPSERRGGAYQQPNQNGQVFPQQAGGIYQPNISGSNLNPMSNPNGMNLIQPSGIGNQRYIVPQNNMIYSNPPNQSYNQNYYMNDYQRQQQYVHEQPMGQNTYGYPTPGYSQQRNSGGFKDKIYHKIQGLGERVGKQINQHGRMAGRQAMYRYD